MRCVALKWRSEKALAYVKRGVIAQRFANWTVLSLEELLLSMFLNSRVKMFQFDSKTQWQMFPLCYGRHVSDRYKHAPAINGWPNKNALCCHNFFFSFDLNCGIITLFSNWNFSWLKTNRLPKSHVPWLQSRNDVNAQDFCSLIKADFQHALVVITDNNHADC